MYKFFAEQKTIERLNQSFKLRVLLIGSFDGYWNFGDFMQLQSTARFYRSSFGEPDCAIFHIQSLTTLKTPLDWERFKKSFIFEDIIFYADENNNDSAVYAESLGMLPIDTHLYGYTILHVYGGGFLNRWWGSWMLNAIESTLKVFQPDYYLISGQQIGSEFASIFAEHCKIYKPDLIGCRDPLSADLMVRQNIAAVLSGDDALEELCLIKSSSSPENDPAGSITNGPTFGIQLNLTVCINSTALDQDFQRQQEVLKALDQDIQILFNRFGAKTCPLVIGSYMDQRAEVENSLVSIKKTGFGGYFPNFNFISLPGLFIQNNLNQSVGPIRKCQFVVTNAYHLTLFCKVLEVPVYLFALNDYYEQKKQGLDERMISLSEFIQIDRNVIIKEQRAYISKQQQIRTQWLGFLKQAFAESMRCYYTNKDIAEHPQVDKINLNLPEKPQYQKEQNNIASYQLAADTSEERTTEEEVKYLKRQLRIINYEQKSLREKLSEQERQLNATETQLNDKEAQLNANEAQLNAIYQSKSWILVQKYRKIKDSSKPGKILGIFEKMALKLFWRRSGRDTHSLYGLVFMLAWLQEIF